MKRERKLQSCLCFGGSMFVVCTAAGYIRQGAGLSCLKAQGENKNFSNEQVFDFQMLAAVLESNSEKGFRLKYWDFLAK